MLDTLFWCIILNIYARDFLVFRFVYFHRLSIVRDSMRAAFTLGIHFSAFFFLFVHCISWNLLLFENMHMSTFFNWYVKVYIFCVLADFALDQFVFNRWINSPAFSSVYAWCIYWRKTKQIGGKKLDEVEDKCRYKIVNIEREPVAAIDFPLFWRKNFECQNGMTQRVSKRFLKRYSIGNWFGCRIYSLEHDDWNFWACKETLRCDFSVQLFCITPFLFFFSFNVALSMGPFLLC